MKKQHCPAMPKAVRGQIKKQRIMDGNYLTAGDLALIENRRGYGYGNGYGDCGCGYGHNRGMAATGIGLAAGLGGGALLFAIAGTWAINQASKARARGMENANAALTNNLNQLATLALAERTSREGWQNMHAPTLTQYVNASANAGAGAGAFSTAQSNALAQAEAAILTQGLLGNLNQCPQKVSLYSAPSPCPCPTSCCNG